MRIPTNLTTHSDGIRLPVPRQSDGLLHRHLRHLRERWRAGEPPPLSALLARLSSLPPSPMRAALAGHRDRSPVGRSEQPGGGCGCSASPPEPRGMSERWSVDIAMAHRLARNTQPDFGEHRGRHAPDTYSQETPRAGTEHRRSCRSCRRRALLLSTLGGLAGTPCIGGNSAVMRR